MPDSYEQEVNAQFDKLCSLAKELHNKKTSPNPASAKKVIVFVGAGPSKAAGLPLGEDLKKIIYKKFVADERKAKEIFEAEYRSFRGSGFRNFNLDSLNVFEFAAILSRFAYGRKVITDTIRDELKKATHRPLSYELLAHFAKHHYLDHFIILNFDRLLCEALEDEISESDLKVIKTPEDIPPRTDADMHLCYAVYPFGLLGEASRYSLTTDDVAEFGCEPVRDFIRTKVFHSPSEGREPIILLLIGYRGLEPAFERLLRSIRDDDEKRIIEVFVINPNRDDTEVLSKLQGDNIIQSITQINLDADLALELLLELLKDAWGESNRHSWISAARHRILAKLFNCANMPLQERFIIELLLQAVKSRGFVHFETFGKVPRLIRYSDEKSAQAIKDLVSDNLLTPDNWFFPDSEREGRRKNEFYVPNYTVKNTKSVVLKFIQLSNRANMEIGRWQLAKAKDCFVHKSDTPLKFLENELKKIQNAPDIEIVRAVEPEISWILAHDAVRAEELLSIDELKKRTEEILRTAIVNNEKNQPAVIRGIWSTGEWLFWEKAWANSLGTELLKRTNVTFKILITKAGGKHIVRSNRREKVITRLQDHQISKQGAKIEVKWINWWEMNRILTIVSCKGEERAIHMRRRLNNPLVCPYYIPSEAKNALKYLDELWKLYWSRGETIPL